MSDNVGGEIMRAMAEIVYAFYNNGDTVWKYTCASKNFAYGADRYLREITDNGNGNRKIYISMDGIEGVKTYDKLLERNMRSIFRYLKQNQNLFTKQNNQDYQDMAPENQSTINWN